MAWLGAVALAVTLAACNPIRSERRGSALEMSVTTYAKLMRWGYYEEAAQYFQPKDKAVANTDFHRLKGIKITAYEVLGQLLTDTGTEARVSAQISYYDLDSGIVRDYRDNQSWWYDEEAKRWHLGSPMPDLVAQLPH